MVQCVSNEEQVAAAVDAGATTLCVAGDSATWATASSLESPADEGEGEDIEDMSLEELQELMEEIGGPRVAEMSLADARDVAWRFVEVTFSAEHDHDHDHDEGDDADE